MFKKKFSRRNVKIKNVNKRVSYSVDESAVILTGLCILQVNVMHLITEFTFCCAIVHMVYNISKSLAFEL